jgi:hypothetical protein
VSLPDSQSILVGSLKEAGMSAESNTWGIAGFLTIAMAIILACSAATPPAAPTAFDPTKAALEIQGTAMALELTQVALNAQEPVAPAPAATEPAPAPTKAAPEAPADASPAPAEDVEARIKEAKILVYEDTDELGIGMWIQDALDEMGLQYTQTGSYSGHFMEYLNSGVIYDLIIVGAENRNAVRGEFWDVISSRLTRDKAALIAEVWYLDFEATGPITKILGPCGVAFRINYPLAESIYWWEPTHPVFNEPNVVLPLLHYNRYWQAQAGDKLRKASGGDAVMLAGMSSRPSSGEGVLATCFEGRVIIQTFSNHDYRRAEIVPLWQNYIHYTLKNHFAATP